MENTIEVIKNIYFCFISLFILMFTLIQNTEFIKKLNMIYKLLIIIILLIFFIFAIIISTHYIWSLIILP